MLFPLDMYLTWQAGKYVAENYESMTILIAGLLSYFIITRVAAVGGLIGFLIYRNRTPAPGWPGAGAGGLGRLGGGTLG